MRTSRPPLPPNYRLVLDVVDGLGHGHHASAQELFLLARERRPGLGFTTVHRALTRLHELGYVLKLDVPGAGSALYEPATDVHAHFRCHLCGSVTDLDFASDPAGRAALQARYGVTIDSESVTFGGRCRACAERPPEVDG